MTDLLRHTLRASWLGLLMIVIVVAGGLTLMAPSFTTEFNLYVVTFNVAIGVIVAFGQMVVVATGGMNVALGAIGGLSAVISAGLMESYGVPMPICIVIGLLAGTAMGFINGFLTVRTGINPFIITLATASAYTGINLGITSANPYYNIDKTFVAFGQARTGPVPHGALIAAVVAILLALLFYRMIAGRWILAVGGNARAAELVGVPVARMIIIAHVLSGLLAAVAGLLLMARLGNGTPTIGSEWLLASFATVVIGGCALEGGHVSIVGVGLATILLALIENGLVIGRADPYWVTFLLGALILVFVGLGRVGRKTFGLDRLHLGRFRSDAGSPGGHEVREAGR